MKIGIGMGLLTALGILLAGLGFFLLKEVFLPETGLFRALPYVCIGLGCGAFGHGLGDILSRQALKSDPSLAKRIQVEQEDERNIALSNRAKGKAFDLMLYVFGALLVCFALMEIDLAALLLLVAAYLFVVGSSIYYRLKYEKEM